MIELGKVDSESAMKVATRVGQLVREHGEVALFISPRANVLVGVHHDRDYRAQLEQSADMLVGLYTDSADAPERHAHSRRYALRADIRQHLADQRAVAGAAHGL